MIMKSLKTVRPFSTSALMLPFGVFDIDGTFRVITRAWDELKTKSRGNSKENASLSAGELD